MNTPPLLLGATLIFWGWQTGLLWPAVLAALALEGARLVPARWDFPQADLNRIWNLCVLIFFGTGVYALAANDGMNAVGGLLNRNPLHNRALVKSARSVILIFQWMPLAFLPIVLAQAYSRRERMDFATFSWWMRRQRKLGHLAAPESGLNVTYPYLALTLVAASAANERSIWFSIGLALLVGWALWPRRPRGYSVTTWAGAMVLAVAFGFAAQAGLRALQQAAQQLDSMIMSRLTGGRNFDPKESRTMLGAIGRVKLSGRIHLRVEADGAPPALLREASYNLFKGSLWGASKRDFVDVVADNDPTSWTLLPERPQQKQVTIAGYLPGGVGVLAVPLGVTRLEQLPVFLLDSNRMGVLRSKGGPNFVRFRASYGDGFSIDDAPDADDREVPPTERAALAQIAEELRLAGRAPADALKVIEQFFAEKFRYSTWLGVEHRATSNQTALAGFLLQHRSGHCEYFATATTLLLRQAGIPARYAAGYSVQERKGAQWIIRGRHAHAWSLAWLNGAWRDVDTTPGSWAGVEAEQAPWWEGIRDAFSRGWYEFSKWRWSGQDWRRYLIWLVVPLVLLAGGRIMFQKKWRRAASSGDGLRSAPSWPGLDSEFYQVEQMLAAPGLERRAGETFSAWLQRIEQQGVLKAEELKPVLALHQRLRFDPQGISAGERTALRRASESWRERMTRSTTPR